MSQLASLTYRKIIRASAIYDVLVTAAFAAPWSFTYAYALLSAVNQRLGGAALPVFEPLHVLFAGLLGSLVLMWSALRIGDPQQKFGRYDGVARMLFTAWMLWTLHMTGAPLLWLFVVPEFAFGVAQWLPVADAVRGHHSATGVAGIGAFSRS